MKKVLIIGGAGFVGFHLAKKLISENYQVDLLDNFLRGQRDKFLNNLLKEKNIKFFTKNILDKKVIKSSKKNYDIIFHLAAIVGVDNVNKNPDKVLIENVISLSNAVEIAKKQKKISQFIFTSSSEVYAGTLDVFGLKFPTPENTPLAISKITSSRTTYMLSKIYGEAICNFSSLPFTILRPHNLYGPRMGMSHVIPELTKKILKSKKKLYLASPDHKRSFCFIDDAIEMIFLIIKNRKKTINKTFNLGNSSEEIKIKDLAKKIIKIFNKKIKIIKLKETPGSPYRRVPNIQSLVKTIKYKPKYNLNQGLNTTIKWYRKNILIN